MVQRKPPLPKRMVWRISESAPLGEFVDPNAVPVRVVPDTLPEASVSTGGWVVSSFELLHGADIQEESDDTVPADLFDELFPDPKPPRAA